MTDLISRQAAIDAMAELPYGLRGMVKAVISNQPTIDAVPVVRCGNCAKRGKNGKGISGGCPFGMTDDTCDPNTYCSYGVLSMKTGERKDADG